MTDPTSLPSFLASLSEHSLHDRVVGALLEEGYTPTVDDEGDVVVRLADQQLFVRCVESVPALVRVFGQWLLEADVPGDELTRLKAANAVTGALNLVKATVHGEFLVVAVDLLITDSVDLRSLLVATMDAVIGSVQTWHSTVLELCTGLELDHDVPGHDVLGYDTLN